MSDPPAFASPQPFLRKVPVVHLWLTARPSFQARLLGINVEKSCNNACSFRSHTPVWSCMRWTGMPIAKAFEQSLQTAATGAENFFGTCVMHRMCPKGSFGQKGWSCSERHLFLFPETYAGDPKECYVWHCSGLASGRSCATKPALEQCKVWQAFAQAAERTEGRNETHLLQGFVHSFVAFCGFRSPVWLDM